jgi:hypothetical protein
MCAKDEFLWLPQGLFFILFTKLLNPFLALIIAIYSVVAEESEPKLLIPADEASGYSTGSDTVSLETGFEQF